MILTVLFFLIATIYSIAGFGGGSSYIALLVLTKQPIYFIPIIALICNIIVVSHGTFQSYSQGHVRIRSILPFLITSIPMAYIGGTINISVYYYQMLLATCLMFAGIRLLSSHKKYEQNYLTVKGANITIAYLVGGIVGLISGMVGIGGGIFLSPILYFLGWGSPKNIAAYCSFFILVNSLSGLMGQYHKLGNVENELLSYWPLFLAVFFGGLFGSYMGASKLTQRPVALVTAILILVVSIRLYINVLI